MNINDQETPGEIQFSSFFNFQDCSKMQNICSKCSLGDQTAGHITFWKGFETEAIFKSSDRQYLVTTVIASLNLEFSAVHAVNF